MRRLTLRFILAVLALLTLSRLGLAFWQWDRVQAAGGLAPLLVGGLRIDVCLLSMVIALPAVFSPWFGHRAWAARDRLVVPRLVDAVRAAGSFTPQFIAEYDTRPNRLYFIYLLNPKEVGAMLWQG